MPSQCGGYSQCGRPLRPMWRLSSRWPVLANAGRNANATVTADAAAFATTVTLAVTATLALRPQSQWKPQSQCSQLMRPPWKIPSTLPHRISICTSRVLRDIIVRYVTQTCRDESQQPLTSPRRTRSYHSFTSYLLHEYQVCLAHHKVVRNG